MTVCGTAVQVQLQQPTPGSGVSGKRRSALVVPWPCQRPLICADRGSNTVLKLLFFFFKFSSLFFNIFFSTSSLPFWPLCNASAHSDDSFVICTLVLSWERDFDSTQAAWTSPVWMVTASLLPAP